VPQRLCAPVVISGIELAQGEVLDLGRRILQPMIEVAVKVIDSTAKPVEGVAVVCLDDDGGFGGQKWITHEDGIALVRVATYSSGQFVVIYHDRASQTQLEESTPYEAGGGEDAGRQFVLQLSDEMLYHLLK
jgi:hypothetical protein